METNSISLNPNFSISNNSSTITNNINSEARRNKDVETGQPQDTIERIENEVKQKIEEIKEAIKNIDLKKLDAKTIGLGLLGAALGGALAYFTFNLSLIPTSFLLQLLFSGGVSVQIPQQIIQLLQTILGLGIVGSQYGSIAAGAISGAKTTSQMAEQNDLQKVDTLKIDLEKFKDSKSFIEYIRNGFNLGVEWGKSVNEKAGGWANIPLALATSLVMMAPLALLLASLSTSTFGIGLIPALLIGLAASLPIGAKVFSAVKNFAQSVYGLIGGAIGGAVGAVVGGISKVFNTVKGWFSKDDKKEELDEFQKNSPYKNTGVEKMMESGGKVTESFLKGSADVLSFTGLINNILTKQPSGLGTIASIVGGTIKSFEGASILKNSAVNNQPQNFKVGLFRFLSGFSMLLSFLGPLFGPLGIVGFSVASLLFMGLEKFFSLKNTIKNDQNTDNKENTLKNSYAIGTAGGEFVDGLGSLGKFWTGWDTLFGGQYGGLTSIFGLIGSTRDILQGAKMMQLASERNNVGIGIQGILNVIGGVSLALAALGLGRIFGFVSLGIEIAKLAIQISSMISKENTNINEKIKEKLEELKEKIFNQQELKEQTANS